MNGLAVFLYERAIIGLVHREDPEESGGEGGGRGYRDGE